MHERIFGTDYPLFVDPDHTVLDLLESVTDQPDMYQAVLQHTSGLAAEYTVEKASDRLAVSLADQFDQPPRLDLKSRLRSLGRHGR